MSDATALGRTIRIYLADGTPTGIRHAELANWTGQAIVCPRPRLEALLSWPEVLRPGVYLLVGQDENAAPRLYVGESGNVGARLQQHLAKKDFWQHAVLVTSKDENLTKAHVKYLESRLQELARRSGRVPLEPGNRSAAPRLPKPDQADMEVYLSSARLLVSALGFSLFEPEEAPMVSGATTGTAVGPTDHTAMTPTAGAAGPTFHGLAKGVEATGHLVDEGFLVLKGSLARAQGADKLSPHLTAIRADLLATGAVMPFDGGWRFERSKVFASPSTAAAVITGSSRNGRIWWKTRDGVTLQDALAQRARHPSFQTDLEDDDAPTP